MNTEKQLEEAQEELDASRVMIKNARDTLKMAGVKGITLECLESHVDKYLKQKDPLFEKFKKIKDYIFGGAQSSESTFEKFKEIFSEELNGTKGIEELIAYLRIKRESILPSQETEPLHSIDEILFKSIIIRDNVQNG